MQIYKTPSRWEIIFEYSPRKVAAVKRIKGARFQADPKMWILPPSTPIEVINKLQERFGSKVNIADAPLRISEIPELPDLEIDLPLKRPLFPFQAKGVAFNLLHKRTLIGDDMGLGKTTQAVASCVGADRKCILVVCPSAVKTGWQREFETVAGWKSVILTDSIRNRWMQYHKMAGIRVFITNYESLKKYFVASIEKNDKGNFKSSDINFKECCNLFDCVIFDESHKIKEKATFAAKVCLGLSRGKEYRFCLTGTPIQNKPIDLFTQLAVLGYFDNGNDAKDAIEPNEKLPFGNIKYFMHRYCGGFAGQGATNKPELGFRLKSSCYYRREKREVFAEMPKIIRNIISCEITTRAEYIKAESNLAMYMAEIEGKSADEISKSMRAEILVTFQKCLHVSALGKLESVFEKIDEIIECEEKYLLFVINQDVVQKVMERYPTAVRYTGSENQEQRTANIHKFQTDKNCNVIVVTDAGGTGLDGLQKVCSRGGLLQFPWHSAKADQWEARLDRLGQKEQVQWDWFLGIDTRDERVYEIIETKRGMTADIFGDENIVEVNQLEMIKSMFKK